MTQNPKVEKPTLFPYLVYRDARTAFNWLANVFGFRKTADGVLAHLDQLEKNNRCISIEVYDFKVNLEIFSRDAFKYQSRTF